MESFHTLIYNAKEISLPKLRVLLQRKEPPTALRPIIWKLLLGYLPISSDRFEILKMKRKKYHNLASRYVQSNHEHLYEQIRMDAIRTHVKKYKNLFELPSIQEILIRVPYVLSKEKHCDYFQGITDICAALLLVFSSSYCDYHDLPLLESEYWSDIEADLYYCLKAVLEWMSPHLASSLLEGFKPSLDKLDLLIKMNDPSLHSWFQEQQVEPLHFAVRWFLLLMSREFNFECVMRLFDIYFAIGKQFFMFHVYVCASTLSHFSPMLKCLEFNELLPLLQRLPTADWDVSKIEEIIENAKLLMKKEEEFAEQILYVVGIPTLSVYLSLYTQFVTYVLYEASVNKK